MEDIKKDKIVFDDMSDFFNFIKDKCDKCNGKPLTLYLSQKDNTVIVTENFADVKGLKFKTIKVEPN